MEITPLQERRIIVSVNDPIENIAKEFKTTIENINQYRKEFCPNYEPINIKPKPEYKTPKYERKKRNSRKRHIRKKKRLIEKIPYEVLKKHNLKYISIMDWGFWVRQYKNRKVIIGKTFRYSHYKTALDCIYAAMEWRKANLINPDFSRHLRKKPMPSNKLQIAGVYKTFIYHKTQKTEYYRAFWTDEGKQKCKYFNIDRLGKKEALRLAVSCRSEAVERINGGNDVLL